ncbi:hypothetical protein WAJ24_21300, partial [Acinetobacter baumannii]
VCRHEQQTGLQRVPREFLNGVCRHEQKFYLAQRVDHFLNGVCRHELNSALGVNTEIISKWRMPP